MPDKRALKIIGIAFAALTLTVISAGAFVVAGHAADNVGGGYIEPAVFRD
jgi:hypothetical protein